MKVRYHNIITLLASYIYIITPVVYGETLLKTVPLSVNVFPGTEVIIKLDISNAASLFGLSFVLSYDNKSLVDPISADLGDLFGSDVVFFPNVDASADEISVGISKKHLKVP